MINRGILNKENCLYCGNEFIKTIHNKIFCSFECREIYRDAQMGKSKYNDLLRIKPQKGEVFKDIKGFEGRYQISNFGRIKCLSNRSHRKEIIKKTRYDDRGYERVLLYNKGKYFFKSVHRLKAIAFIPNPENKPYINHIDGNPSNNDLSNLEWCTNSENVLHADKTGLRHMPSGENAPHRKMVICKNTGAIYPTIRDAARKNNISFYSLGKMLSGAYKNKTDLEYYYPNTKEN